MLFRDLAVHDSLRFPWRDLQWALRRLEDRGLVRGGRFVSGFSGEQYALPAAVEQLTQARKAPRTGERVTVNATDPLNLVGVIVPGARVPAVRTNRVTYVDGVVEGTAEHRGRPARGAPERARIPPVSTLHAPAHEYRDYAELLEDYYDRGWTDGLPVVPPTPESVAQFLGRRRARPPTSCSARCRPARSSSPPSTSPSTR